MAYHFKRDQRHDEAVALWADRSQTLATTNLVVGETWTFLRRRVGHAEAVGFLDNLDSTSRVTVIQVDDPAERSAIAWLRRHDERPYSFADATSFAVMRTERMTEALAFDGDFSAAGFIELRI